MNKYLYFIIFILIISCSTNKGVYWCGDHVCANNKEKEAYFKKTMIVEVRNLNKNDSETNTINEKILNLPKSKKKADEQNINLEEKQIELQEKKLAKQQRNLEEQIDLEEKEEIITKKKKEKNLSTINKVAENNEINSKDFDELVENILTRNSTRSYPKINDIPK